MKHKLLCSIFSIFLFILVLPVSVNADIFDIVTPLNINYAYLSPAVSDVITVSDAIRYNNTVEVAYQSSTGIKNLVMNKSGGTWSRSTLTVSGDTIAGQGKYQFPLIQNETEIHLFYPINNGTDFVFKQYKKIKGTTTWSFVQNAFNYLNTSYQDTGFDCVFGIDNSTIYCGSWKWLWYGKMWTIQGNNISVSLNFNRVITDYLHIDQSSLTGNVYITAEMTTDISGVNYLVGLLEVFGNGSYKLGRVPPFGLVRSDMVISGIHSPKKDYHFVYAYRDTSPVNEIYYVFDTSDNLGINCTTNVSLDLNWYHCYSDLHTGTSHLPPYNVIIKKSLVTLDNRDNIHFIYFGEASASGNRYMVSRMFQNNSHTNWYYHNITYIDFDDVQGYAFTLFHNGSLFLLLENNEMYIYEENQSLIYVGAEEIPPTPPTPPPIPVVEENPLYLICDAGVFLTGSSREGGCLIVSLFVLAIAISIIGRTFHYYEGKYKKEISNRYIITGAVAIIMIVITMMGNLTDLFTGIISIFVIIALLLVFEERAISMRR